MAVSKYQSTWETTNLVRISRIILGPCTNILRDVLMKEMSPSALSHNVRTLVANLPKFKKPLINKVQEQLVYCEDYSNFDIILLYHLLRNVCSLPPHKNQWGHNPCPRDRSVSANIERIRIMRNELIHNYSPALSDLEFEHKWEDIFQIVQELEGYLGSSKEYQKSLIELKTCLMDPDVGNVYLVKFQCITKLENEVTKRTEELEKTEISISSLNVKAEDRDISSKKELNTDKTKDMEYFEAKVQELERNLAPSNEYQESLNKLKTCSMDTNEKLSIIMKYQSLNNLQKYIEELEEELEKNRKSVSSLITKDIPPKKYEQITSETLKKLFISFKVDFPADVPGCESFARKILEDDINKLVTAIRSLSNGIVLTTQINAIKRDTPQVEACVFEVDVVYDEDSDGDEEKFCVFRKDTSFETEEDARIRVILIRSKSLPVVSAKLIVYKNFKHVINEKGFFLQHEYDEIDDVAKLIAYRVILSFCSSIESLINAFTADLLKRMAEYFDKTLTADKIRIICLDVLKNTGYKPFGSAKSTRNWSSEVADLIQSQLSNAELKGADAWSEIKSACCTTVEDLKVILDGLEKFQANEFQIDQKEHIVEWHKMEVIRNKSLLHEYPSIIKYIAGHGMDGKDKVKVYLSGDDEKAKQFFEKECREILKDPDFEFVNVEKTNEIPEENEDMELLEEEDSTTDKLDWTQLTHIIQKYGKKIYARYSNVIGIQVGNVTGVDDPKQEDIGIILCCLDKNLIPFGENPLPKYIEGWPCGAKEDFFMFGACPKLCSSTDPKLPEPGCSIGIPFDNSCGSTGFLYKSNNQKDMHESGFLTATHVAIKNCRDLYLGGKLLSDHQLGRQKHAIVHPSYQENNASNNPVGEVIESFFGDYGNPPTGLDCAVVRSYFSRQKEMELLTAVEKNKLNYNKRIKVKKTGKATGTTYGYLIGFEKHKHISARLHFTPDSKAYYEFQMPYVVRDMYKKKPFFRAGDSGSGVLVLGENDLPEKALGIAFGYSYEEPYTFVCNIEEILTKLNLELVRDPQDAWIWSMED